MYYLDETWVPAYITPELNAVPVEIKVEYKENGLTTVRSVVNSINHFRRFNLRERDFYVIKLSINSFLIKIIIIFLKLRLQLVYIVPVERI